MSYSIAAAQNRNGQPQVTSVTPGVICYNGLQGRLSAYTLKPRDLLRTGDVIETGKGKVVIALGDGSQVTIFQGSSVKLKDFYPGSSWRDLLEIAVGRVRATINHRAKRLNPYRVNSPIASIAVRGTDFLVIVEPSGETRVVVYEGLVEVSSLVNPLQTVLVRPGRNVVVRPGGDIGLVSSGPGSQLYGGPNVGGIGRTDEVLSYSSDFVSNRINDQVTFFPLRFTAFSDSHFDSLQNPAFAAEFTRAEARFYFLSSLSRPSLITISRPDRTEPADYLNHTSSAQSSFFIPIGDSRNVVGGSLAMAQTWLTATDDWQVTNNYFDDRYFGYREHEEVNSKLATSDVSFVAARRLDSRERISLGIKLDYLTQRTSYSSEARGQFNEAFDNLSHIRTEQIRRRLDRTRVTVGFTRRLAKDRKIGVFYRYGSLSENITPKETSDTCQQRICLFYTNPNGASSAEQTSSEVGSLFRGSINSKLFYGFDGGFFFRRRSQISTYYLRMFPYLTAFAPSESRLDTDGKSFRGSGGIGYALDDDTVLSFDLSGGAEHYTLKHQGNVVGNKVDYKEDIPGRHFVTVHVGGQKEIRNRLLASGSFLFTSGCCLSIYPFLYSTTFRNATPSRYLNLSAGWRIKPHWIAQYAYSSDFGTSLPSHTLMFRYDLGGNREK